MNVGLTGVVIGFLGVAISLTAFWFAWRMTKDKPTARIAAMIGEVSLSLLTAAVVYELNRGLGGQAARSMDQPR
jgi:uncharacterized membrane protein